MKVKKTTKFIFVLLSILVMAFVIYGVVIPTLNGSTNSIDPVYGEIEHLADHLRSTMAIYYSFNDSYPHRADNWEELMIELKKIEYENLYEQMNFEQRKQHLVENYEVEFDINIEADDYTINLTSHSLNTRWNITDSEIKEMPLEEKEGSRFLFFLIIIVLGAVLIEIIVSLLTKFDVLSKD